MRIDRHIIFLTALPLFVTDPPASAQDVSQAALAECAAKATVAEKLACYEGLTGQPEAAGPPEPAAAKAPRAAPAPAATMPDDLGEEYLKRSGAAGPQEPERIVATVSEVTESRSGRLYFRFTNGQVWRQNEARRFRYPRSGEFDVIISRGMMGDYQLRIDDGGPMTRISRVE